MFNYVTAALEKVSGNYGSMKRAGYADPGFQSDLKPRYPLKRNGQYNERRIRSAWRYIHEEKNQEPYTPEQVEKIKEAIAAAWKEKIDKNGPPSIAE